MSTELLALITLILGLTLAAVYIVVRLQRVPEVVVFAMPDIKRPAIINLVLKNSGKGIACNVRFESSGKIPARAFGFDDAPNPGFMTDGPLINGIPSFRPGEKLVITWGQYGGLNKGLGGDVLEVTAIYFNKPPLGFRPKEHRTKSRIDLRSLKGTNGFELKQKELRSA